MNTTHAIGFQLDDQEIDARPGESILQVASRHGIELPCLCYQPGYRADGNCRACVVEIEGERALAPSCRRQPTPGMHVDTRGARARKARALVIQLLAADRAKTAVDNENDALNHWLSRLGLDADRFAGRRQPARRDTSHPAIAVDLSQCIQCGRCVRACREEQANDVIGYAYRGARSRIVFDLDDPLGDSSCVACGECVRACPTGALAAARGASESDTRTESICPYCGVGCLLSYRARDGRIVAVEGRDGPANHGRLCVKGRFGFDYVHHAQRLTHPLIRRDGVAKRHEPLTQADIPRVFRETTWDEALDVAATGLRRIRDTRGSAALAGYGSAKGSNEEAYLFQKLVRTGFGTNNVDHCTRLCHASSVTALLEGIGSSAVTNQVEDVENAEVIIVIGAKPTSNHPVAATFMKNAAKRGATLILLDPYRSDLARHADYFLRFHPDTDVALLNAMMHCIVEEGLHDQQFIDARTEGFEALRANLRDYSPERVAPICGIAADTLRAVARRYATARAAMIFWGMGITQHIHGTDNARCLIALALLTGQIGRAGAGLHPLRGQNNVQGASDMGLIPMVFPGYRPVSDADAQADFRELWGSDLDARPGLTVVEIMQAAQRGQIRGMYIEGENPAMSDPNLNHTRAALAKLDHLVVQDIFFTETASYADVILPASAFAEKTGSFTNTDRRVQIGRQAIQPPGDARQDLWIIQQIARRLGLDWHYPGPEQVFEELCRAVPDMAGMSWARLEREHSLTYPLRRPGDSGQATLFTRRFPTASGRGRFVPARYTHADELPDDDYPLVFTTGRQLEHWHTGAMSRRARVLDALEPVAVVSIHPDDLKAAGGADGKPLCIRSRRGEIVALAHPDDGIQRGVLFMAFCYAEAAANLLTNEALDPDAKIPEFKYCAVNIRPRDRA